MTRGINNDGSPNRGWFKSGDPKLKVKSKSHRAAIAEGQRRSWRNPTRKNGGERPIGTRYIDRKHGYVRIKVADRGGRWAIEHVVVMEKRIGRKLTRGEIVHHIDGNRANNADENLFLCRSHAHHMAVERQLKETFRAMLKSGAVTFSQALGVYSCH